MNLNLSNSTYLNETTFDAYVLNKQKDIDKSKVIMEIANDLHHRNKYKSEPIILLIKDYKTGDLLDYDLEKIVSESKKILQKKD